MLQAGKGLRVPLTMDLIEHVTACMEELQVVLDAFEEHKDMNRLKEDFEKSDWEHTKDNYGDCFWADFNYSKTEVLRLKVVVGKEGKAKLDIRSWFEVA